MKRILWFVLSLSFWQLNAQDFDGVYFGEIFSMKNTFVLSTTGNTAIGSIYLNQNDKIIFL